MLIIICCLDDFAASPISFGSCISLSSLSKLEAQGIFILSALEKDIALLKETTGIFRDDDHQQDAPRECLEVLIRELERRSSSWMAFMDVLKEMKLEAMGLDIAAFLGEYSTHGCTHSPVV